jgi:hypothetical protein
VAHDPAGTVVGVVSYAVRPRDGAGLVLWLHGREDPTVIGFLLDRALGRLRDLPVADAFDFATALGLGLEALPVRHRAATRAALEHRGFSGRELWRYLHRWLPAPDLPRAVGVHLGAAGGAKRCLQLRTTRATGDRQQADR